MPGHGRKKNIIQRFVFDQCVILVEAKDWNHHTSLEEKKQIDWVDSADKASHDRVYVSV